MLASIELDVRSKGCFRYAADTEVGEAVGSGARLARRLGGDVDQGALSELDVVAVDFDPSAAVEVDVQLLLPGGRLAVPRCGGVRRQFEDLAAECGDSQVFASSRTTPSNRGVSSSIVLRM
jgi:hypothetical protein